MTCGDPTPRPAATPSPWPFLALAGAAAGYLAAAMGQWLLGERPGLAGLALTVLPHQALMLGGAALGAMAVPAGAAGLAGRLGLRLRRGRDLLFGGGAALLLFLPLLGIAQVSALALGWFGFPAEEPALLRLARATDLPGLVMLVLAAVVLAPVAEELVFRRVLYACLRRLFGASLAMALGAAVFALFHFSMAQWLPLFLFGLALQAAVRWGRSLWPAIAMHAVHNALAIAAFLAAAAAGG